MYHFVITFHVLEPKCAFRWVCVEPQMHTWSSAVTQSKAFHTKPQVLVTWDKEVTLLDIGWESTLFQRVMIPHIKQWMKSAQWNPDSIKINGSFTVDFPWSLDFTQCVIVKRHLKDINYLILGQHLGILIRGGQKFSTRNGQHFYEKFHEYFPNIWLTLLLMALLHLSHKACVQGLCTGDVRGPGIRKEEAFLHNLVFW